MAIKNELHEIAARAHSVEVETDTFEIDLEDFDAERLNVMPSMGYLLSPKGWRLDACHQDGEEIHMTKAQVSSDLANAWSSYARQNPVRAALADLEIALKERRDRDG